jgi:hypothetical protein
MDAAGPAPAGSPVSQRDPAGTAEQQRYEGHHSDPEPLRDDMRLTPEDYPPRDRLGGGGTIRRSRVVLRFRER